jgi:hypothetical protein
MATYGIDTVTNFPLGTLTAGIAAGASSLTLGTNEGGNFPAATTSPDADHFNITIWNSTDYANPGDDPNVEILRCTARSGDVLTISRAQEGTSDVNHNTGGKTYRVAQCVTKKMVDDIRNLITWVNVKDYGALGDGATDDINALDAAATALGSSGGTIYFPPGFYIINSTWDLKSTGAPAKIKIKGAGQSASVIQCKDATLGIDLEYATSYGNVSFEGIELKGNKTSGPSVLLSVKNTSMLNVHDVHFVDAAILLQMQLCQHFLIYGNTLSWNSPQPTNPIAIRIMTSTLTGQIIGNTFECGASDSEMIQFWKSSCGYDIAIVGNTCSSANEFISLNGASGSTPDPYAISVVGNVAHAISGDFIHLHDSAGVGSTMTKSTVIGNAIDSDGTAGGMPIEVDANSSMSGCILGPNTYKDFNADGYLETNTGNETSADTTISKVVTHGLGITPSVNDILITLTNNPTNDPGPIWVSSINSTTFTVNFDDPGSSGITFSWRVFSPNDPL